MQYLLAIDCGLTFSKAVIFSTKGKEIAHGFRKPEILYPQAGWVERDMEHLRRRCAPWLREIPSSKNLEARWTLSESVLRWHVAMEGVLEPDIDIEVTAEGFVVRALPALPDEPLLCSLLPVPPGFDVSRPRIRFESGYLEVRVYLKPRRGNR